MSRLACRLLWVLIALTAVPAMSQSPQNQEKSNKIKTQSSPTQDADTQGVATTTQSTSMDAPASSPAPNLVTLGPVDGEADDMNTAITFRFDRKPPWDVPGPIADHGSFLQIELPATIVPEPGRFYDGVGPYIKKMAVLQHTPSDAAIRLFVDKNAAKTREAAGIALLDRRLVFTLDHQKLNGLLAAEENGLSAESVVAKTEVTNDITPPSELVKSDTEDAGPNKPLTTASALNGDAGATGVAGVGAGTFDMREKLIQTSVFCGIMIVLLLLSLAMRPYLRRRAATKADGHPVPISMKTLATLPLAARQKISLIQVGDEKILIGVTPEHVSFLTTIGKPSISSISSNAVPAMATGQGKAGFARMLSGEVSNQRDHQDAIDGGTLEMQPKPVLKNIPGNDEESLRVSPRQILQTTDNAQPLKTNPKTTAVSRKVAPKPKTASATAGTRINVAVGDDGIKQLNPKPTTKNATTPASGSAAGSDGDGQKAIDDVTRLIREKLKTLRTL